MKKQKETRMLAYDIFVVCKEKYHSFLSESFLEKMDRDRRHIKNTIFTIILPNKKTLLYHYAITYSQYRWTREEKLIVRDCTNAYVLFGLIEMLSATQKAIYVQWIGEMMRLILMHHYRYGANTKSFDSVSKFVKAKLIKTFESSEGSHSRALHHLTGVFLKPITLGLYEILQGLGYKIHNPKAEPICYN